MGKQNDTVEFGVPGCSSVPGCSAFLVLVHALSARESKALSLLTLFDFWMQINGKKNNNKKNNNNLYLPSAVLIAQVLMGLSIKLHKEIIKI